MSTASGSQPPGPLRSVVSNVRECTTGQAHAEARQLNLSYQQHNSKPGQSSNTTYCGILRLILLLASNSSLRNNTACPCCTSQMWHGPFLQHQQHKRDQLAQALFLKQQQLKQQAIRTWGAAVAAGKAERAQERAADQHLRQQQQQRALRAWLEVHQREQVEQQQLALAAQPTVNALQRRMQRRVMRTWRQVTAQQQTARQQVGLVWCLDNSMLQCLQHVMLAASDLLW